MDDTTEKKSVERTERETCYFCEGDGPIETHHIIPRRLGGDDSRNNLVDLCPTCHRRLERLYDERFYAEIGAEDRDKQLDVILDAAAMEIEEMAEELRWEAQSLRRNYTDTSINDVLEHVREFALENSSETDELEVKSLRSMMQGMESMYEDGALPVEDVIAQAIQKGMERNKVEHELEKLRNRGEIYENPVDHYRLT